MPVQPIVFFPDRRLSQPCRTANRFDATLDALINDLIDTMEHSPGVGLAAPQIGVSERVSVIDVRRTRRKGENPVPNHGRLILINPILLSGRGRQLPREGCLSVPDLLANVRRYEEVTVRLQERNGGERIIRASGFEALALQHEIDHLDGKLFLDRVTNVRTDVFRRAKR